MTRIPAFAGALALGLTAAVVAQAQDLRAINAFPESFVFSREIAQPFAEMVAEESDGAVTIAFTGPDAVPPLEQFEPTQAGVFDILFTHPAYHAGTTPVGLAIDAIAADPAARREAGILDYIDAHYRETQGMKLIAAPPTGSAERSPCDSPRKGPGSTLGTSSVRRWRRPPASGSRVLGPGRSYHESWTSRTPMRWMRPRDWSWRRGTGSRSW